MCASSVRSNPGGEAELTVALSSQERWPMTRSRKPRDHKPIVEEHEIDPATFGAKLNQALFQSLRV
jgi:hypothetical protein